MSFPKHSLIFGIFGGLVSGPAGWVITGLGITIDAVEKYREIQCDKQLNHLMIDIASTRWGQRMIKEEIEKLKTQGK